MPKKRTMPTMLVVAAILARPDDDHYGFELMRVTGVLGGTLYAILDRLVGEGWLTVRLDDDETSRRPQKRLFQLTEKGKAEATEWMEGWPMSIYTDAEAH